MLAGCHNGHQLYPINKQGRLLGKSNRRFRCIFVPLVDRRGDVSPPLLPQELHDRDDGTGARQAECSTLIGPDWRDTVL